jgi:hypothetical protein
MADPITQSAARIDLTDRIFQSSAVAGSPAAGSITTVCSVTWSPQDFPAMLSGVELEGFAAFTVGTSGISAKLDIRRTSTVGTLVATTGALTVVAANLVSLSIQGWDTVASAPGQVWVLCLTIGSGAATSTVSAAQLFGTVY